MKHIGEVNRASWTYQLVINIAVIFWNSTLLIIKNSMLNLQDYLSKLTTWNEANYKNNSIVRPDSTFYKGRHLTTLQRNDLGLLLQTLLKSDANRIHLRCDDWHQTDELFGVFLATLCFYKYAQNQTETPVTELYKTGTVIYHTKKEEVRVIAGRNTSGIITRPIKEETVRVKGEKYTQTQTFNTNLEQAAKYIPLANISEHTFNRNALGNLADYFELFNNTLLQHRALTQFPRRLVVVAPYATIQQLPKGSQLPIRYQFNSHYTVPVVNPLIEVVNRYDMARSVLRKDGNTIDEVVVLGDIGYRESINDLLNDLGDGYFRRVIILGSQPIQPDYKFQCWPWSRQERAWIRTGKQDRIERITLPADNLKSLRPLFVTCARQLVAIGLPETEANASINRLIGQHLRDAFVDVAALLVYQQTILDEPDSIWRSWFEEADQLDSYPTFCQTLIEGLRAVGSYITSTQAKLKKISELARRHPGENTQQCQTWVIARSKQVVALNDHFASNQTIKAISYRELKTLLNNPAQSQLEQFIFPALHLNYQPGGDLLRDYSLYRRATERGRSFVLAYEGLEDGLTKLCEWLYHRDEHKRLTHPDRQFWVNFSCASTLPVPLALTGVSGLLAPLLPAETESISELLDELELLDDDNARQSTRTAEILLKLNESFTKYFGVWKDIRKSYRKVVAVVGQQKVEEIKSIKEDSNEGSKRYLIRFRDYYEYELKESVLLAKVQGEQVVPIKPMDARKGDLIVRFTITLDTCLKALQTIPEAREALKEVKWASKTWRSWLRKSIEYVAFTKKCSLMQARKIRYEKLLQLVRADEPTTQFVQFQRFEQWLDKTDDYIFPRTINHLEIILATHLNQVVPAEKPAKLQEMKSIMAARDQSASFREVVTKLNTELTQYLIDTRRGKLLAHMPDHYISDLLKTRTDRFIQNIEAL